jgi:hypothetical protein
LFLDSVWGRLLNRTISFWSVWMLPVQGLFIFNYDISFVSRVFMARCPSGSFGATVISAHG